MPSPRHRPARLAYSGLGDGECPVVLTRDGAGAPLALHASLGVVGFPSCWTVDH